MSGMKSHRRFCVSICTRFTFRAFESGLLYTVHPGSFCTILRLDTFRRENCPRIKHAFNLWACAHAFVNACMHLQYTCDRLHAYVFYVRIYMFTHIRVYNIIPNCVQVSLTFTHAVTCTYVKSMCTYMRMRLRASTSERTSLITRLDTFGHSKCRKRRRNFTAKTFGIYTHIINPFVLRCCLM